MTYAFHALGILHSYAHDGHKWIIPNFRPRDFQATMEKYRTAPSAETARAICHLVYWYALRHFEHHFLVRYNRQDSNFTGAELFDGYRGFDIGKKSPEELAEEVANRILKNIDAVESPRSFYTYYKKTVFHVRKTIETATLKERDRRTPLEMEGTVNADGEMGDEYQNPEIAQHEAYLSSDFRFLRKYFDVLTCDEKKVLEYLQTGGRGPRMSYVEIADALTRDSVYERAFKNGKVRLWTESGVKKIMSRLRQRLKKVVQDNENAKLIFMRKPMTQKAVAA